MSEREFALRALQYYINWAGTLKIALSYTGNVETIRRAVRWDWPPLVNPRPAVTP
jgi:hypothetical protein